MGQQGTRLTQVTGTKQPNANKHKGEKSHWFWKPQVVVAERHTISPSSEIGGLIMYHIGILLSLLRNFG